MTRRKMMLLAWQFVRENGFTMSEAMSCAWENEELVSLMRMGIVEFGFRKKDGSVRMAHGTLQSSRIPETKHTGREPHRSVQVYFDTDANEWRCFKKDKLLNVRKHERGVY